MGASAQVKTTLADEATHASIRLVVKEAASQHGMFSPEFAAAVSQGVEDILGPHQAAYDGQTGVRWTRLEADDDGTHLFVKLEF